MEIHDIEVPFGKYAIGLQTLKKDDDEVSAMANYLSQVAVVTKQKDFMTLSLLLQEQQTITGFQIKNASGEFIEAVERQIDNDMDRRYEMFMIETETLPSILGARVQYEVTHEGKQFQGDEVLRLSFNEESIEKIGE